MADQIKVAVITQAGGAHLGAYFPALAEARDAASVVLADSSGDSFERARKALGSKLAGVYKSHAEMLAKEKPKMAMVSMEAVEAPAAIDACLDAGVHVFAEKPACIRAEDFAKLAAKADSKHLFLMLALANRKLAEPLKARELVDSGTIGKVYGIDMHFISDQTRLTKPSYHERWYAQKARAGGGHLTWLGIHWLDLAMWVTGSRCLEVSGFKGLVGGQPIDVEDSAAIALRFDNGTFGTLTSGYYLDRGKQSLLKIWGSAGWLSLDLIERKLTWYSTESGTGELHEFRDETAPRGYSPFVAAAVTASARDASPPITAQDSLHVLQTIFAAYTAAETGRTQRVG